MRNLSVRLVYGRRSAGIAPNAAIAAIEKIAHTEAIARFDLFCARLCLIIPSGCVRLWYQLGSPTNHTK